MDDLGRYSYQHNYSKLHAQSMHDKLMREQKAKKIISVLKDYFQKDLGLLLCLDIGCSAGWISNYLCETFAGVVGIDIDKDAVLFGASNAAKSNVRFIIGDSMFMMVKSSSFDVLVCSHVYEHVPDKKRLMKEIYRVLKPGGVCYFAGPNKLWPVEPHYNLLGLNFLPGKIANWYVKFFRGQDYYYERLLTYWQLKRLAREFEITDYTSRILKDPARFMATDMIRPNSFKAYLAGVASSIIPWLSPTFVWVLCKR